MIRVPDLGRTNVLQDIAGLVLSLTLACGLAAPAAADDVSPYAGIERFSGLYHWVGGDAEQAARLEAIEVVVQQMSRVIRRTARKRLRAATHISELFDIEYHGDEITISIDDGRSWTTPLDGTPILFEHLGEPMTMSRRWRNGTIYAVGQQKVGAGTYVFRLSEDGQILRVAFSMDSDRMPAPVRFDTTYRRQ
jgi:hypothetical protein